TAYGARLVLVPQGGTGRKIAYSRLRVTDATGRSLPARMEVESSADFQSAVSRVCNPQTDAPTQRARAGHTLPIANRRYSRMKTCATSESTPLRRLTILVVVV